MSHHKTPMTYYKSTNCISVPFLTSSSILLQEKVKRKGDSRPLALNLLIQMMANHLPVLNKKPVSIHSILTKTYLCNV